MRKSVGLAILRSWVQIPGMANKISLSVKNLILPLSFQQGVNRRYVQKTKRREKTREKTRKDAKRHERRYYCGSSWRIQNGGAAYAVLKSVRVGLEFRLGLELVNFRVRLGLGFVKIRVRV